ncbi:MAG: HD-GYP domain-containing protein [Thermoanaerobacteraceae bacterium]|nr:HD-GYP domain-containing protein [Thermoanaerobacteraceae bacterium]
MRKLPLDCLRPGMEVARPIYSAEGRVLLNKGVILKPYYIRRLRELGVPAVYVVDELVGEWEVQDVVGETTRLEAVKLVKEVMEASRRNRSAGNGLIASPGVSRVVENILDDLLRQREIMVNLVDIRAIDDYTFGHSVNVCILALITGITLGYRRPSLIQLGMGALFHDIGKTLIPFQILNKPGPLTPEEYQLVCHHCRYGFDILAGQENIAPEVAMVALEHHERYDGTGYPQGLRGEEIHEFAAITGIVDVYDALTADRVYRRAYLPHEAYEMLAGAGNFRHDYRLVRAFLFNIAAYPSGTLVQLNTGEIGVVLSTPRGQSYRPRVRLLYNKDGGILKDKPEVDLSAEPQRWVSRVIPPEGKARG